MPKHLSKLIVILGPTASGKTELGIKLAKKFNGEIICADSRTVYQEMNIGTDKPLGRPSKIKGYRAVIIENIPHYMIDIVRPDKEFTVAQFKTRAVKIIKSIQKNKKIPFLIGGTGLYISSIVDNLEIPRVPPDKKLRNKIQKMISKHGLNYVFNKLIELDPDAKNFVQQQNPRRIIRALEVCLKTKKPFSKLRKKGDPLFNILQIGIKIPLQELYKGINQRTDKMIKSGLIEETKKLIKKYPPSLPLFNTIGYQEIIPYLLDSSYKINNQDLKDISDLIKKNTRHYARRQMTWFKRDRHIQWTKNYKEAEKSIKKFLS